VKDAYGTVKKGVKSKTGQKVIGMVNSNAEVNKAKKQLKDYMEGKRKTKPGKKVMEILEKNNVISKIEDEMSGGVNRPKKAYRWKNFAKETANDGIDLGSRGYTEFQKAVNPVGSAIKGWFGGAYDSDSEEEMEGGVNRLKKAYRWKNFAKETANDGIDLGSRGYTEFQKAVNPVGSAVKGWFGGAKKQSPWIAHVKSFSQKNGIPYKEALKAAGPSYKALKAKM